MIRASFLFSMIFLAALIYSQACSPEMSEEILDEFLGTFGDLVEVDITDATPPAVSLVFIDPASGNKVVLKPGEPSKTMSIKKHDRFFVMAVAEDPQGVKKLTIYPSSNVECEPLMENVKCKVMNLSSTSDIVSNAQQGENTATKLWLPRLVDGRMGSCPRSCKLKSAQISTYAHAENFSGLTSTSPSITFTVQY